MINISLKSIVDQRRVKAVDDTNLQVSTLKPTPHIMIFTGMCKIYYSLLFLSRLRLAEGRHMSYFSGVGSGSVNFF